MNKKHLLKLGFGGEVVELAHQAARIRAQSGLDHTEVLDELQKVQAAPQNYLGGGVYAELAAAVQAQRQGRASAELRPSPLPYGIWGAELIEAGALGQMDVAMRLPITRAGALMPDAHIGYGLPIGGVLATENAVIPYGVGVDIGCSMMLSVLPVDPQQLSSDEARKLLLRHTRFGAGVGFQKNQRLDHPVMDERTWQDQGLLRSLQGKAAEQLGTSGSGNHFVEFGTLKVDSADLGLEPGEYLAILSHSGSRGLGAQVAGHFTKVAESQLSELDPAARRLAWLGLDTDAGQAYWRAMNLAGRYALANHDQIHARLSGALNAEPLVQVSNSHNLAWKQDVGGQERIVHRKGATPAEAGRLGLIPGSMADPSFVVRGLGNPDALSSSSHGAGRQLGRKAAERSLSRDDLRRTLHERGVTLIGGGLDEAPQAYKRIEDVLARQRDLVDVVAEFTPRVVRMDTGKQDI
ncbi:RtcB family protein [Deinococcus radiophilus]|uniref:3'-phosphate/5'-hydroxy nucleic acid ligase n=1 Tax=Deinococcus radiophilus TaxID=32062 RepID=A0A3S0L273_9DEIO|nr:RtcB family protein [Deinococcus radiophilus]RTR25250.1 RtcB family protein [Deinococcus radiophilus]UFA50273.1 RtcB family protein [Deinococcus radiophilus]